MVAAKHGTRRRYVEGCRCKDCTEANRLYFCQRRDAGRLVSRRKPDTASGLADYKVGPGPVESGVEAEIAGLADARPGLAQTALALARIMDSPKAVNQQPAAAKVLAALLDKLHSASAQRRRGNLALVRSLTDKGGA
jgi:hypothetical protein